jgi:WhiB family transcriptional regulator, redox-sensing transcriptional regulator
MTGRASSRGRSGHVPWFEDAACAAHPEPDLWFSDQPADRARARKICEGCPARAACFTAAAARREDYGTWGGRNFEGRRFSRQGPAQPRPAASAAQVGAPGAPYRDAEQLGLALVLPTDPTRPAGSVAALLGVPVEWVLAAIDAGELPARHDGEQWQVPLWAVPAFARSVA